MLAGWKCLGSDSVEVAGERAQGRGRAGTARRSRPSPFQSEIEADREARRRRLEIALDARDLPGEPHPRARLHPVVLVEMGRRVDEGVAVDLPEADEAGVLQARDHPQHALLLAPLHARLEADQVELALGQVLLPELHHRPGAPAVGGRAGPPASSARSAGCPRRAGRSPRSAGTPRRRPPSRTRAAPPPRPPVIASWKATYSSSSIGAVEVVLAPPPCPSATARRASPVSRLSASTMGAMAS